MPIISKKLRFRIYSITSSLPQYRLGTVSSEEELRSKLSEFNKARLVELLDAEKKIKDEAIERANQVRIMFFVEKYFKQQITTVTNRFNISLG